MSRINDSCMEGFWLLQSPFFYVGGKIYSAVELKELTIKPKINDISLEVLREFYEMFLYPFIYTYTITQNGENKNIFLRFNRKS